MLKRKNAATLLKILSKIFYSIKCYDKTNMNVFTLSLLGNFSWVLTYLASLFSNYIIISYINLAFMCLNYLYVPQKNLIITKRHMIYNAPV